MSAILFLHKLCGLPDPGNHFIIRKLLSGAHKVSGVPDSRLPITLPILHRLLDCVPTAANSFYSVVLLRAMFLLAFYALLRVGEFTCPSHSLPLLQKRHISSVPAAHSAHPALQLSMSQFKHKPDKTPVFIVIQPSLSHPRYCPVKSLLQYLSQAGPAPGPLFHLPSHLPVSRHYFCSHLSRALRLAGLNPALYKSHSFRLGMATHCASLGLPPEHIKQLGRWRSDAWRRYIRIPQF